MNRAQKALFATVVAATALLSGVAGHYAWPRSEAAIPPAGTAVSQIKAGVVFAVPLVDGTTAAARCENVGGLARLTYSSGGQFVDLLLSAWATGPAPNPTPGPQPTPTPTPLPVVIPPAPPVVVPPQPTPIPAPSKPVALIVITPTLQSSGSWTTPAVQGLLQSRGVAAYNYAVASVADDSFSDAVALKWIGKSAEYAAPCAFLSDASGNVLWSGPLPPGDAAWSGIFASYSFTRRNVRY